MDYEKDTAAPYTPNSPGDDRESRRSFLRKGAVALAGVAALSGAELPATPAEASSLRDAEGRSSASPPPSTLLDFQCAPDFITAYGGFRETLPVEPMPLQHSHDSWSRAGVSVGTALADRRLVLTLTAPSTSVAVVHVRWHTPVKPTLRVLGDAWERSYGDLGWRDMIPQRVLPWYFATSDGQVCHGYGVQTQAGALCFWQLDPEGVSLWLNVANGGDGVLLGDRTLHMATVVSRPGSPGESGPAAVGALCAALCSRSSRPTMPIYGANDWCYSYGHSTAQSILRDTAFIVELSPAGPVRPFSVIDGGWEQGTPAWPDMAALAHAIKARGARPGLWVRPLAAPASTTPALLLPAARFGERIARARELAYDPTHPAAAEKIRARVAELTGWGYEMLKHDFSTYDLLGQWGFEMGPQPTLPGWSLHDRSRTNAEVIASLYSLIRDAAGGSVLLDGCNTVGHLGQGIFDLQRTGDDTSGRQWERTRRMGVNTLAFRLPQHGRFFIQDADVVGITDAIPWELNRQWLDVLARSGTTTLVSAGPPAHGLEQRSALREAFALAANGGCGSTPIDWAETSTPERWKSHGCGAETAEPIHYRWNGEGGASPFLSP